MEENMSPQIQPITKTEIFPKVFSTPQKEIKVKPEIILKDLPSGDPEQSDGTYEKIKDIIDVNIEKFIKLEDGLSYTIGFMETELNR